MDEFTKKILWDNETSSNIAVRQLIVLLWIVLVVTWLLSVLGVFWLDVQEYGLVVLLFTVFLITPAFLCRKYNGRKSWLKVVMLSCLLICVGIVDAYLGYNLHWLVMLPIVVSIRYYSKKLTLIMSGASFVVFFISCIVNAKWGQVDASMASTLSRAVIEAGDDILTVILDAGVDREKLVVDQLIFGYIPQALVMLLFAAISAKMASRGQRLLLEQASISAKTSRISTELNLASSIQTGMLPSIFPPFPERHEFDIYASMTPAKEVGGDFYDFFMIDQNHLALVMADVSGKGVPAALFMMIAKTLLKTQSQNGHSPSEVLQKVNNQLCENNPGEMFVSVWFGIYEISTGKLVAANAGHEYPAVRKGDGNFELLKDRHGFVLAGMENSRYKEYEIQLDVGDSIFVYTDGIPEATNANVEQFGADRMLAVLNKDRNCSARDLLTNVHDALIQFVDGAEQFDDVTMLSFCRKV